MVPGETFTEQLLGSSCCMTQQLVVGIAIKADLPAGSRQQLSFAIEMKSRIASARNKQPELVRDDSEG